MGNLLNPLVYMPPPKTDISGYSVEYLSTTMNTTIPFVYLRGRSPVTLLYSHGNAEDLGGALTFARGFLVALGVSVCCYEYSGYGYSTGGGPSEAHIYADVEAAYEHLVQRLRVLPSNIIIVGRSLGTGPSTYIAAKNPGVKGLVLISALASVYRVTLPMAMQTLPGDSFCSIDRIHKVKAPLLLLHGTADTLTSTQHAIALADRAEGPVTSCFLSGAKHGSITAPTWWPVLNNELRRFLSDLNAAKETSSDALSRKLVLVSHRGSGLVRTYGIATVIQRAPSAVVTR